MKFAPGAVVGSANAPMAHVPSEIVRLAERLKLRHGNVRIVKEKSGYHLYFASPICLERHGIVELSKQHLALNAEKYLCLGSFARQRGTYNQDSAARCMKTGKNYRVSDLLVMPPLAVRGIQVKAEFKTTVNDTSRALVQDAKGNWVPDVPGTTVSLLDLPKDHPAVQYLTRRRYDIPTLVEQFACSFCTQIQQTTAVVPASNRWGRSFICWVVTVGHHWRSQTV